VNRRLRKIDKTGFERECDRVDPPEDEPGMATVAAWLRGRGALVADPKAFSLDRPSHGVRWDRESVVLRVESRRVRRQVARCIVSSTGSGPLAGRCVTKIRSLKTERWKPTGSLAG
jgi:hypothetical protein